MDKQPLCRMPVHIKYGECNLSNSDGISVFNFGNPSYLIVKPKRVDNHIKNQILTVMNDNKNVAQCGSSREDIFKRMEFDSHKKCCMVN